MQAPTEVVEVDAPHDGMKQEGMQGLSALIFEDQPPHRRDFQVALVLPHQPN